VPAEPPSAERARVLWAHGRTLATRTSQYAEAEAVLEEALIAARRAGSRPDGARAMASLGYLQAATGRTDAGIGLLSEACASTGWLAEDAWGLSMAQGLLSETLAMTNRLDEAARVAMGGWKTQCTTLGLREHRYAYGLLGKAVEALFELGRWADAARICEARAQRPASVSTMAMQLSVAELEAARGQGDAALARLDDVERVCPSTPRYRREFGQRRAELLLWLGRPGEAVAEVGLVLDAVAGTAQGRLAGWVACLGMRGLADVAELAWARRDPTAAAEVRRAGDELTERLTGLADDPFAAENPLRATAPAERALWDAERSRLDGTPDPAGWQDAVEAWQRLGRPYRVAYCQWRRAEALLAAGDTSRAADALRAAHTTAVELAAGPLRAEVDSLALRARISLTPDEPAPAPARPYDLTERELSVLRLLAAGHTNREIGQQLFISPKTASVHVTNILRKLAVRDRVQAATLAVRSGLVDPRMPPDG
jgi:DNA-binding CsgD family transcriptional regulator